MEIIVVIIFAILAIKETRKVRENILNKKGGHTTTSL